MTSVFPTAQEFREILNCEILEDQEDFPQYTCRFSSGREVLEVTMDFVLNDVSARIYYEDRLAFNVFVDRVFSLKIENEGKEIRVDAENLRALIGVPPLSYVKVSRIKDFDHSISM